MSSIQKKNKMKCIKKEIIRAVKNIYEEEINKQITEIDYKYFEYDIIKIENEGICISQPTYDSSINREELLRLKKDFISLVITIRGIFNLPKNIFDKLNYKNDIEIYKEKILKINEEINNLKSFLAENNIKNEEKNEIFFNYSTTIIRAIDDPKKYKCSFGNSGERVFIRMLIEDLEEKLF